mmetsp:Transcript_5059/g.9894  ORF Transcript_5059/g.9894 Transcript_5059/m.9894 type:complete len:266 (-) Transcript_5059:482-1279(-)
MVALGLKSCRWRCLGWVGSLFHHNRWLRYHQYLPTLLSKIVSCDDCQCYSQVFLLEFDGAIGRWGSSLPMSILLFQLLHSVLHSEGSSHGEQYYLLHSVIHTMRQVMTAAGSVNPCDGCPTTFKRYTLFSQVPQHGLVHRFLLPPFSYASYLGQSRTGIIHHQCDAVTSRPETIFSMLLPTGATNTRIQTLWEDGNSFSNGVIETDDLLVLCYSSSMLIGVSRKCHKLICFGLLTNKSSSLNSLYSNDRMHQRRSQSPIALMPSL